MVKLGCACVGCPDTTQNEHGARKACGAYPVDGYCGGTNTVFQFQPVNDQVAGEMCK